jgi:hypothetical protein
MIPRPHWNVTKVKTAAYSAVAGELVKVDTSAGAVTVTLPDALAAHGLEVMVFDYGGAAATHNITVSPRGSETITPAGGGTISTNSSAKTYISDGANWLAK